MSDSEEFRPFRSCSFSLSTRFDTSCSPFGSCSATLPTGGAYNRTWTSKVHSRQSKEREKGWGLPHRCFVSFPMSTQRLLWRVIFRTSRRLPEFKFWVASARAVAISFVMTFFEVTPFAEEGSLAIDSLWRLSLSFFCFYFSRPGIILLMFISGF